MKFLRTIFLSILFVSLIPLGVFASDLVKEENGKKCLDLEAAYANINDTSKALTGTDNSIDAIKKAETLASLTNILSILIGDRIYCVNDEVAASRVGSFEEYGLLGQLEYANKGMMAYFPSINVGNHLAEMFVPGYGGNNSTLAISPVPPTPTTSPLTDAEKQELLKNLYLQGGEEAKFNNKIGNKVKGEIVDTVGGMIEETEKSTTEAEAAVPVGSEITKSGYDYLKDSLHLDGVWGVFRNIAYLFYILVIIVIGFMIMFRKNLPGQIIVSVGNTIPQVALGLVLVTFSFAIVGIVMDLGKVSMNVVGSIFTQAYSNAGSQINQDEIISVESVGSLTDQALKKSKGDGLVVSFVRKLPFVGNQIADFISGTTGTALSIINQSTLLFGLSTISKTVTDEDVNIDTGVFSLIPGVEPITDIAIEMGELIFDISLTTLRVGLITVLVRNVLLLLVCLYASFRLFITMLMTYLKLFMNVVFAPIQIMIGSLPGNFSITVNWFKSVVSNVLVFVGIYLVVNLFAFLSHMVDPAEFNFFGNKGVFWPDWIISLEGVILIGGYLFASSMPTIIDGILKVEQSKEMSAAGQAAKRAASKMPFIGSMFN